MPQIWMTYEELAEMLDCSILEMRGSAGFQALDRKISRDGNKRVKLNAELFGVFIDRIRNGERRLDTAIVGLRQTHQAMSGSFRSDDQQNHVEYKDARGA